MSQRSPWIVLAVLSLVGSLLALSTGPAAGKNGEQDDRALYSGCPPGSVLESAGFRDIAGYPEEFEDVINCMANYGIMPGLLPDLFQPGLGVTRQQMALILIRAAYIAGIDVPAARNQGFDDIGNLSKEVRDSINQLAQLRITLGTTASTYTPDTVVNRRQMAQFFERFLDLAPAGEGGVSVDAVVPDDTVFEDIRLLPHDPYDAIRILYELGVTAGTTPTTYAPDEPVTRAQMAMFISRMLAHTNALPAGVSMQVEDNSVTAQDTVDLVISVRDKDHLPLLDAPVDLFYVAEGDDGFESSGRCGRRAVAETGDVRCSIDLGDETTDGDGNLLYTMQIDEDLTVYAWTGDNNDNFDLDRTDYASLVFSTSKGAEKFILTDDMRKGARKVPFGTVVTFTFQLVDEDEKPVREEDVELTIEATLDNDGRRVMDRDRTESTDSSGRIELTFRLRDPDPDDNDRDGVLNMDIVVRGDRTVVDRSTVNVLTGTNRLFWSDEDDDPFTLLLEQRSDYSLVAGAGSSRRNYLTATLLDQYGGPIRSERIHFTSDQEAGLYAKEDEQGNPIEGEASKSGYRKTTNRSGVATVNYRWESSDTAIEEIYATVENEPQVNEESVEHYWVAEIPEKDTTLGTVEHHDEDEDTLVIEATGGELYVVTYDEHDHFNDDTRSSPPISYEEFRELLAEKIDAVPAVDIDITVRMKTRDPNDTNVFTLT